jgi:hypothetical protein
MKIGTSVGLAGLGAASARAATPTPKIALEVVCSPETVPI